MRKNLFFISLFIGVSLLAQEGGRPAVFDPPFDFPLYLSGNFGELRSNHFHGGVDFKTQGVEGKPLRCIADGYISRVSVAPGGYGNAIYITHDNGYTSVHGHLKRFSPRVAEVIRAHQYANETFAVDTTFDASVFPVKRGEVVAWAGNSGYSFGPHLHMEIRETATNEPVDPLSFYMDRIKDTTPPRARSVRLYPQRGKGLLEGGTQARTYAFTRGHSIDRPVEAWGELGVAVSANDYMDGTTNNYGVHSVTLKVDGKEVFRSHVDRFSFAENRMINSWTDYAEYRRKGRWFMKSFVSPGNPLRMLETDAKRGVVTIDEERDYRFEYTLSDLYGNTSHYRFTVRGVRREVPTVYPSGSYLLRWNRPNLMLEPGLELAIQSGMLYEDCEIETFMSTDSTALSYVYRLGIEEIPLHGYCLLSIGLQMMPVSDVSKYYVAIRRAGWTGSVGGVYDNGWMRTSIRDLGASYYVAIDTIPPTVEPVGRAEWGRTGRVTFKITDKETGIHTYKGRIDGKFVLFEYSSKTRRLVCNLADVPVERGRQHLLEINVADPCGNVTVKEYKFTY